MQSNWIPISHYVATYNLSIMVWPPRQQTMNIRAIDVPERERMGQDLRLAQAESRVKLGGKHVGSRSYLDCISNIKELHTFSSIGKAKVYYCTMSLDSFPWGLSNYKLVSRGPPPSINLVTGITSTYSHFPSSFSLHACPCPMPNCTRNCVNGSPDNGLIR